MEAQPTTQKQELIDWISNIEDVEVLKELIDFKKKTTFNFDEEFKNGIPADEFYEQNADLITLFQNGDYELLHQRGY